MQASREEGETAMRALVVYESMFGNTRQIAERVAKGLRSTFEQVDLRRVVDADAVLVMHADLVVTGGPTHAHGVSMPQTRQAAAKEPERYGAGAPLEPGADGIGLREWFRGLPRLSGSAAAFDTKLDAPAAFTGRASVGLARRLRRTGLVLVDQPKSFLLVKGGGLKAGEADRAEQWGRAIGEAASKALAQGSRRHAE